MSAKRENDNSASQTALPLAERSRSQPRLTIYGRLAKMTVMYQAIKLSRRQFCASLGGLALFQALGGCRWLMDKPIAIGAHVWPGYEPLFLARSEGWLETDKVQLAETTSATGSLRALTEGTIDGAALTLDETLKARGNGLPLSVVMVFNISVGADMLVARPDIKTLAELKGRRIGVEQSAVGELLLTKALQMAGLSKTEVEQVPITVDKHLAAWHGKQVDAVISYEPIASQLLAQDGVKLFDSRQIPNIIVDVLAMRNEVLDSQHADAIRHLIAAHFRALDHFNRNPQDAAYRMASHLGLPAAKVLAAYKGLALPDMANNYRLLANPLPELLDSARLLSDTMVKSELLKQNDTLDGLICADFLPRDFLAI